jgi:hypothetical protein
MAICGRLEYKRKACLAPAANNSILKKILLLFLIYNILLNSRAISYQIETNLYVSLIIVISKNY